MEHIEHMEQIGYKKGYKYQLAADYVVDINIMPENDIETDDFIYLTAEGHLTIKKNYAWDGPSGPTFDTLNFMRGSLVHDALYQLMRNEHLDKVIYREPADRLLQEMCKEDDMSSMRAWFVFWAVDKWGDPAADPSNKKPVISAPQ